MAAQIVSQVIGQLGSILTEELKQRGRLVLGAEKDVKKLASTFTAIEALLLDAEEKQLKDKGVEDWVNKLKDMTYAIDDVLDEWRTEIFKRQLEGGDDDDDEDQQVRRGWLELKLLEVSDFLKRVCPFLPAYCFSPDEIGLRYDIASRIKSLNESLDDIAKEKDRYDFIRREKIVYRSLQTGPNINFSDVKGREKEIEILRRKLLDDKSNHCSGISSISIQGTGGMGKTTLAKMMYNDEAVKTHFKKRIWVCVSDTFDQASVARAMLESLSGSTPQENSALSYMLEKIKEYTENQRFLLVLDDVWEDSQIKWEEIRNSVSCGSTGSKILLTTRKEEVSRAFDCIANNVLYVEKLSQDACWRIFTQVAFNGWSAEEKECVKDLREIVVQKCYGSPLTAKVLGGVMQSKRSKREWKGILGSEMWKMKEAEKVLAPLALSYYDLPPAVRQCFQFCSLFSKDFKMEKDKLIKFWMAHGFLRATDEQDMEEIGEDYFQILVMRSFFQDVEKSKQGFGRDVTVCKMHDLVHDFSRLVIRTECINVTEGGVENIMTSAPNITSSSSRRHVMACYGKWRYNDPLLASVFSLLESHSNYYSQNLDAGLQHMSTDNWRGIRSLVLYKFDGIGEPWSSKIFRLIDLRLLDLHACGLKEISSKISQMIHLRYLDLSKNYHLKELPEEVCELYNLETLLLNGNYQLWKLPNGMGNKLVNLKHLENEDVPAILPESIGRLTSLKTLFVFKVDFIGKENEDTNIGDLEGMNQLQGCLEVDGLCNITNCEQVKQAQFARKEHLTELWLQFHDDKDEIQEVGEEESRKEEQVLEAIRPSSTSLKVLYVWSYLGGSMFPSWLISLSNLTTLYLYECPRVEQLPPLGGLPSLDKLFLREMRKVNKVGREFLGEEVVVVKQKKNHYIAFPRLTELRFQGMLNWEEWELDEYWPGNSIGEEENIHKLVVMPRLRSLELIRCRQLKKLPDMLLRKTTLKQLGIYRSTGFGSHRFDREHPKMLPREVWDKISHIPYINFDHFNIRTMFASEIQAMSGVGCSNSNQQEAGEITYDG